MGTNQEAGYTPTVQAAREAVTQLTVNLNTLINAIETSPRAMAIDGRKEEEIVMLLTDLMDTAFRAGARSAYKHHDSAYDITIDENVCISMDTRDSGFSIDIEYDGRVDVETTLGKCLDEVHEGAFEEWAAKGWDVFYDGRGNEKLNAVLNAIKQQ